VVQMKWRLPHWHYKLPFALPKKISVKMPPDLSLRLLALLLAVALWFVAAGERSNTEAGFEERAISAPVNVVGVAGDLVVTVKPEPVEVRLRLPRGTILNEVEAKADVTGKRQGEHSVPVTVALPVRGSILTVEPATVAVKLEKNVSLKYAVETAVIGVPAGIPILVQEPEPTTATLIGPESKMAKVARVVAAVLYRPGNFASTVEIRAFDASGREVSGLVITPDKARVMVSTISGQP
jgi:YbbR domain-containing protein